MIKLCDQFYIFNENRKILSVDFLMKYSRKLMIIMGASDYLHGIKKSISFSNNLAYYNYNNKIISIFVDRCMRCVEKENNIKFDKNNYEHIALLNTYLIITITHECFHGIQKKISDQKDKNNTLAANIFYDSLNIHAYKPKLYNQYYEIMPLEVNAEIMGNICAIEFVNIFNEEEALYKNNSFVAEEILINYLRKNDFFSPTKLFYQEIDEKKRYNSLIKYAPVSNYERMKLGLELDDYYIDSLIDISAGKIEVANIKTYLKNK